MTKTKTPKDRVTRSELARIKDVSPAAIGKRWRRYAATGQIHPVRDGRVERVSLAEWNKAEAKATDPARRSTEDGSYFSERANLLRVQRELKELALAERRGELVESKYAHAAYTEILRVAVESFDRLADCAEEIGETYKADGLTSARALLKKRIREIRSRAAEDMSKIPEKGVEA